MDRILIEELIIAAMPIKSLITAPQTDRQQAIGELLTVRGHAWVVSRRVDQEGEGMHGAAWL